MARIMALDYGLKRTGIATTDPLQIIATPLQTVDTTQLLDFFRNYFKTEAVELLVIGQATRADGSASPVEVEIQKFIALFHKEFPTIPIVRHDEHNTSQHANEVIRQTTKKQKRQDKSLVDVVSAAIILQEYMGFI